MTEKLNSGGVEADIKSRTTAQIHHAGNPSSWKHYTSYLFPADFPSVVYSSTQSHFCAFPLYYMHV